MSDWESDEHGIPECFWWIDQYDEPCFLPAMYRLRPKGTTVWYAQSCGMHLEDAKAIYSDPEVEEDTRWETLN
jgi:hypothetical protein